MEKEIAKATEEENKEIIMNNFKTLGDRHDTVNINGMWGLKKKLFPKIAQSKPTGKKNTGGRIITNPHGLKILYLETFVHRLRHRPIREDFKDIKFLKEQLFQMRLSLAKTIFKLSKKYNTHFSGSCLPNLFCRETKILENTWNNSIRFMLDLPIPSYLVY